MATHAAWINLRAQLAPLRVVPVEAETGRDLGTLRCAGGSGGDGTCAVVAGMVTAVARNFQRAVAARERWRRFESADCANCGTFRVCCAVRCFRRGCSYWRRRGRCDFVEVALASDII